MKTELKAELPQLKVGYIRVSTIGQNIAYQEVLMQGLGVNKVFIDKASGKNTDLPRLHTMMNFVREGDTVVVKSISRFARNTKGLLKLIEELNSKQVIFIFKKEAIDANTPTGQFMLTIFGAVATLEREYILSGSLGELPLQNKGRKRIKSPNFKSVYSRWHSNRISAKRSILTFFVLF